MMAGRRLRAALVTPLSGPLARYALAAARAAPSVLWNHGGATGRLARPEFPQVVNVAAPASTYLATVIGTLGPATLAGGHAVLLHATTAFGREVAGGALRAAAEVGV